MHNVKICGNQFQFHECLLWPLYLKNSQLTSDQFCISFVCQPQIEHQRVDYILQKCRPLILVVWPLRYQSDYLLGKKITESSIISLWNGVLIHNGKENKEAGAIYFEISIPRKKNKESLQKVPSKIYGSNFIMEEKQNIFWFVSIFKYHHREMGLLWRRKNVPYSREF